jgi:type IV pilus assembly protein PilA
MTSMSSKEVHNEGKIKMRKQKGFSLIELLIVVAIILIIAAIAIPNLLRARMAANDSSAAASEHTIIVGEVGYYGAYPTVGYGTLAQLGGAQPCVPAPATGCLIDNTLAVASTAATAKSGYIFSATPVTGPPFQFWTTASPTTNQTGTKAFCAVDDGVVRNPAAGVTTPATSYANCQTFNPMNN